jgi:hypothetical protein
MQVSALGDIPWPVRLFLILLCPGYIVGLPLFYLVGAIGLASFGFLFLVGILANGLIFGLASYLIRRSIRGERVARLVLTIGTGVWITWGTVTTFGAWPWPEHLAPVDLSSPLAGRWNGVLHAERGDRSIVLVCHPRADSTLDGYLYVHDWDMGSFENGVHAGDSLHFEIVGFNYSAHFDHGRMAMVTTVSGMSNVAELQFVSADTSRPAPAAVDLTSPLAGRWDGVLSATRRDYPVVLVCHPHLDQVLDGYLYIPGMGMGRFEGGSWAAESLRFEIDGFRYNGRFDSTTMAVGRLGRGLDQSMALRFVGTDTTRPAIPPASVHFP